MKKHSYDEAILRRLVRPDEAFPTEAANAILRLHFDALDNERLVELADKGNRGLLTKAEFEELEFCQLLGRVLEMLHSKARRSLKRVLAGT